VLLGSSLFRKFGIFVLNCMLYSDAVPMPPPPDQIDRQRYNVLYLFMYSVGQIRCGQLIFLLVASECIYKN